MNTKKMKKGFWLFVILGVVIYFEGVWLQAANKGGVRVKVELKYIPTSEGRFKGAITAAGNITANGNMIIDGRCHNMDGTLMTQEEKDAVSPSYTNTYGISTAETGDGAIVRSGNASIGGNESPAVAPVREENEGVTTKTGEDLSDGTLPHEILGFPSDAALRSVCKVWTQADVDNNRIPLPLTGANYIEASTGNIDLGESTGLLIVHNCANDAMLGPIAGNGTFKGVIITDDIGKINANTEIIGALFTTIPTPGDSSAFGPDTTGNAAILYSPTAIKAAGQAYNAGANFAYVKKGTWEKTKGDD
jgi:hypothetical protein